MSHQSMRSLSYPRRLAFRTAILSMWILFWIDPSRHLHPQPFRSPLHYHLEIISQCGIDTRNNFESFSRFQLAQFIFDLSKMFRDSLRIKNVGNIISNRQWAIYSRPLRSGHARQSTRPSCVPIPFASSAAAFATPISYRCSEIIDGSIRSSDSGQISGSPSMGKSLSGPPMTALSFPFIFYFLAPYFMLCRPLTSFTFSSELSRSPIPVPAHPLHRATAQLIPRVITLLLEYH
jgi:hypothetical protein